MLSCLALSPPPHLRLDLEKINVEWCAQNNYYDLEKINVESSRPKYYDLEKINVEWLMPRNITTSKK
jgi:hypothetical protein